MAGCEEKQGEGGLSELLPPSHGPPQHLSQGIPGELPQDGPSLRQPQLSLPHQEDKQEADDEEESQRTEGQFDGVLDEDTVAEGLHKLGRSAPGVEYVYLNLSLSGRELSDINILSRYVHLQKLELSYNKINDLSCISHMPHLLELNASNNELTTYFAFKPPKNLKEVDFSYNQIPKMQDLSAYQSLTILLLDYNNIEEIRGLEKCHSLTHLSLSHNRLIAISGLENLPIRILNLSSNQIEKITGLDSLKTLQKLDLSSNKITSLEGLEKHDLLEMINLEDNQIAELRELEYIEDLPLLRVLSLLKNPVQEQRGYWLLVIFMVLQLTELDLKKISVEEKVAAVNKYDPPPEVVAARDHMTHVMYSMLQPQRIFDSTLPSLDAPYPMLVLVGPLACGKRELTHKICRQFNNFFRYGYILLVPMNKEKYEGHLRRKGLFSRPEIEEAVSRVDMYIRISQGFPGYFDAVVNTDELDEAFTELSFLVKAYLGLEPPAVFDSIQELNSRAGAGSRIRLLREQRLSPGGVITGTTRSSSVNEFLNSSAKNYPGGIPDNLAAQLGSVEEASLQRRRSAARQALSGKAPSACVQLFQRDLAVTPALSSSHQQLLEPTIHTSQDQSFPLTNPESRSRESGPASGRFLISAGTHAAEGLSVQTPVPHAHLTEEAKAEHQDPRGAENRVDRSKESELLSDNLQRKNSKSKTGFSHVPQLIDWPGSHSKPVLPPIPSGRKRTNP
ncbi:leucine-rich repeat and guanylate kinase domain-containing protein isoform 5-T5 [Morphnus guianensis]